MSAPLIRQALSADIPALYRLHQQWFAEDSFYGKAQSKEQIEAALGPYFLVAEIEMEIIALISGSVGLSEGIPVIPAGESYIEIDNLYVLPEFRGQGTGSELVGQLLAQAKMNGLDYALVGSSNKDIHSILRFYEGHNFQSWYVRMFQKL